MKNQVAHETPMRTPAELAAVLGLSPVTIAKFCREGRIAAIKVGKLYRIPPEEFARIRKEGISDQPAEGQP